MIAYLQLWRQCEATSVQTDKSALVYSTHQLNGDMIVRETLLRNWLRSTQGQRRQRRVCVGERWLKAGQGQRVGIWDVAIDVWYIPDDLPGFSTALKWIICMKKINTLQISTLQESNSWLTELILDAKCIPDWINRNRKLHTFWTSNSSSLCLD